MKERKKYFLHRNQQYYFHILFNVHPESMAKIDYKHFGIGGMSLDSPDFNSLVEEISGLQGTIEDFLERLHIFTVRK